MLRSLKLHNFKTFLNTELRFSQRHLLLGKNSSGKTNVAKALQFLAASASLELNRAAELVPGGIGELCNWNLKNDQFEISCDCRLEFEGQPHDFRYELKIVRRLPTQQAPMQETELRIAEERLVVSGGGLNNVTVLESNGHEATMLHEEQALRQGQPAHKPKTLAPKDATMLSKLFELDSNRRAILFRGFLRQWAYYSISPLAIRTGSSSPASTAWLDSDARQLSNAIFHLKNVDERRYRRVIEHVHIVEPSLQAILFVPAPDRSPVPFVELEAQPRASWSGLSDGTLRALALGLIVELASAYSPPNWRTPCLGIIEEPENGIFPGQLRQLFDLFEEWAPSAQFIFTSHSPYFIDMFDDKRSSVTIFKKTGDRSEIVRPPPTARLDADEPLTLSAEYASELFE
jgi:predicted ATPase